MMGDHSITALVAALEDYTRRKLDMAPSAKREATYHTAMAELDTLLASLKAADFALAAAHRFIQEERENRESAGGDMTDYVGEAREVEDLLAAALGIAVEEPQGEAHE